MEKDTIISSEKTEEPVNKEVKGYKAFNSDLTCKGFQYEIGKTYEMNEEPVCCERGFHFCKKLIDVFTYYDLRGNGKGNIRVAEVTALGKLDKDESGNDSKLCTNKIRIDRELTREEFLKLLNDGEFNTGIGNGGDSNTGDHNIGRYNSGSHNIGYGNVGDHNVGGFNIGDSNVGDRNVGIYNAGDYNVGDYNVGRDNTGNYNAGNHNTGDFNVGRGNAGCFNTTEPTINMFNKPSNWTRRDWLTSDARFILIEMPKTVHSTPKYAMTDKERKKNPHCERTGWYVRTISNKELAKERQEWWDGLSDREKAVILALPNFDAKIFKECTNIEVKLAHAGTDVNVKGCPQWHAQEKEGGKTDGELFDV